MKNLIQKITLPGMVGLAGLVSGCTVTLNEESAVNNTLQNCKNGADTFTLVVRRDRNSYFMGLVAAGSELQGFTNYTFWCDPKVEFDDGEIKLKYVLKEKKEGSTYPLIGLSDGRPTYPNYPLVGELTASDGVLHGKIYGANPNND